jgi:hypothetical protein
MRLYENKSFDEKFTKPLAKKKYCGLKVRLQNRLASAG